MQVKVTAVVAALDNFPGFWSAGVFFPNGQSTQIVDENRLGEIHEDQKLGHRISVISVSEPVLSAQLEETDAAIPPKPNVANVPPEPQPGEPGSPAKKLGKG